MNKFHERLKELRKERQIKQSELAALLSVDQRTISNWENGLREPDYNMLIKIASVFEVSTDYLLCVDEHDNGKNRLFELCNSFTEEDKEKIILILRSIKSMIETPKKLRKEAC